MNKSNNKKVMPIKTIANDYFQSLQDLLSKVDLMALERVVQHLRSARERNSMIFVLGNGGSAATASHFANDLGKSTKDVEPFFRILSLADNVPWLTALANDEGYDQVFSGQLENYVRKDDVVIAISASGNSRNVICALELAKKREALTIGLTGFDGGLAKDLVDVYLHVPSLKGVYTMVEDVHMILLNIITNCLRKDAGE